MADSDEAPAEADHKAAPKKMTVLIVRTDLGMNDGTIAKHCAVAAVQLDRKACAKDPPRFRVVGSPSAANIAAAFDAAKGLSVPTFRIRNAAGVYTVSAIGPAPVTVLGPLLAKFK